MSEYRPVLAHHLILTCYGFWLPNDPRGSGSLEVWAEALQPFGPATYINSRQSVASRPHDVQIRRAAKAALKRPPVRFTGKQALLVTQGIRNYVKHFNLVCLAFAVMPDHMHLIVRQTQRPIRRVSSGLKAESTTALLRGGMHPYQHCAEQKRPKIWARGERVIYLFDQAGIERSVRYVEQNPVKMGLKPQQWSFVSPHI